MATLASFEEAIDPTTRLRLLHEPVEGILIDIAKILHVRFGFFDSFACCNFAKKPCEIWMSEFIFEVLFEALEAVSVS